MDLSVFRIVQPRPSAIVAAVFVLLASMVTEIHAATVDLATGVLFYETGPVSQIENLLTISLVGGLYTIDDRAEAAVTLLDGALDATIGSSSRAPTLRSGSRSRPTGRVSASSATSGRVRVHRGGHDRAASSAASCGYMRTAATTAA
ncbi:MAG: hypothetical protein ABIR79_19100 [Candidatus Binatia bacterium]